MGFKHTGFKLESSFEAMFEQVKQTYECSNQRTEQEKLRMIGYLGRKRYDEKEVDWVRVGNLMKSH